MNTDNDDRTLYRSRNGVIFGVCEGVAKYFNLSVSGVRIATVVLFLFTGVWPVFAAYIIGAILIKPEPVIPFSSDADREFYDSYSHSRKLAVARLKDTYEKLERRIRRMEDIVTDREFEWREKLDS